MSEEERRQLEELKKEIKYLKDLMMGMASSVEYRNTLQKYTLGDPIFKVTSKQIGFYGATPVTQASKINDATGGLTVDSQCRAVQNSIVDALEGIGITALS